MYDYILFLRCAFHKLQTAIRVYLQISMFSDNRLFDVTNSLKLENVQLTIQNEKLRLSSFETNVTAGNYSFVYIFL